MKLLLLSGVILIMGFGAFGYMHEQVHVEIYRGYGIESHVEYFSHFPAIVTIGEKACQESSCELAHNINDAIGYHLGVIYMVFGLLILIIIEIKDFNPIETIKQDVKRGKRVNNDTRK